MHCASVPEYLNEVGMKLLIGELGDLYRGAYCGVVGGSFDFYGCDVDGCGVDIYDVVGNRIFDEDGSPATTVGESVIPVS
ncbi:hypothetical protein TNCV_320161 [Trichonephila clavipes]|nr:hypothetical protein TNCV_320161 [Trichonephila clavipes]